MQTQHFIHNLFSVFVYHWDYYSEHVGELFSYWNGGMATHGVLLGETGAVALFCRLRHKSFLRIFAGLYRDHGAQLFRDWPKPVFQLSEAPGFRRCLTSIDQRDTGGTLFITKSINWIEQRRLARRPNAEYNSDDR